MARVPVPHLVGEPQLGADFAPGTLPDEAAEALARFLEEAEPVLFAPGTLPDPFSDSAHMRVRVGIMTDGHWVWTLAWSDHVRHHRVAPPPAFVQHAVSLRFSAPEVSVERALDIARAEGIPLPD
ncbi:hypothetical protein GCM10010330_00990 [Streptomyces tendae]|uniref:hypothetical protein n=1 Tax=Streptomyces tendae TaxID=1932 RepID=UPI00167987DD|nr:hypothetical protein [Streptomyces tendae]GHA53608.1 hypothetical protein GCM10010330_00990 [Streptomyces tendae]